MPNLSDRALGWAERKLAAALRHLHLSRTAYALASRTMGKGRPPALTASEAELLLQAAHPDGGRSALRDNRLHAPEFDVQLIVPAYNAEAYIEACLDSILAQQTRFRVLTVVVNDGSTDRTAERLAAYAGRADVEVITQENKGFSGARNAGLADLRARYIGFVDADDCLRPDAIERLVTAADAAQADMAEGGFARFSEAGRERPAPRSYYIGTDWTRLDGYPWAKIYRAELFAHLVFPENYWFEDTLGVLLLYPQARRIVQLAETVYDYRINPQGITLQSRSQVRSIDAVWVTRRLLADAAQSGVRMDEAYVETFMNDAYNTLCRMACLGKAEWNEAALILTAQMVRTYFPNVLPKSRKARLLREIILQQDYARLRLFQKLFAGLR